MSKKIKKSSGKKVKSAAKPAQKAKAKKVFANKKTTAKKAVKKAAPAKKAVPSKKPVVKAKPGKTNNKIKAKSTTGSKAAIKKTSKPVAKTAAKPINKPAVKSSTPSKAPVSTPANRKSEAKNKPARELTTQAAKNSSSSIKSTSSANNKPVPVQKAAAKTVIVDDNKSSNDPPGKFELEYVIHSSAELLFNFLTEPSGLSEWFCDDVNIRHGIYTFFWDGSQQQAKEMKFIPDRCIRFQWIEKHDGTFFEFRIEKDELTSDISLIITDFAENEEDRKSLKLLWDSQIDKLLHVMGAYF